MSTRGSPEAHTITFQSGQGPFNRGCNISPLPANAPFIHFHFPTSRGILNILSLDYNTQSTVFPATLFRTFAPFLFPFFIPLTSTSPPPHSPTSGNPYRRTKTTLRPSFSLSLSRFTLHPPPSPFLFTKQLRISSTR